MPNRSKIADSREWRRWGAAGAIDCPNFPPLILTVAAEATLQCTLDEMAEWAKLPRYEMGTHRPDVTITWDVRDKGIVP